MTKFKLLLLLPLVVCTGYPRDEPLPPYADRLVSMMGEMMLFIMHTGSVNYDAYFFAPALMSLQESEFRNNGFLDFFAQNFTLADHASNFHFSENETREEFTKRFFHHIANEESVPSNIREIAARFTEHYEERPLPDYPRGFISPCPLYPFVRAVTLMKQAHTFGDVDINNVEVVIKFLLTEFNPLSYGIEDNADVYDISATLGYGLGSTNEPLTLTDGTVASQVNKELFERLATTDSVPQNVKDALAGVVAHM